MRIYLLHVNKIKPAVKDLTWDIPLDEVERIQFGESEGRRLILSDVVLGIA